jgi:hypothetical protein
MASVGGKAMRMQVECPICNTKLVFEVLPQYAGRTVRVICTGCDTPIDASTDAPQPAAHHMLPGGADLNFQQGSQDASRLQLANGIANRMHGQGAVEGASGISDMHQQGSNPQQQLQHQQSRQQQQPVPHQQGNNGATKSAAEKLKFEVQCPHPQVMPCHPVTTVISRSQFLKHTNFRMPAFTSLYRLLVSIRSARIRLWDGLTKRIQGSFASSATSKFFCRCFLSFFLSFLSLIRVMQNLCFHRACRCLGV